MSLTIAALVPMRHVSERVPGKNYRLFGDKPLYQHIIGTLSACREIDVIFVDTDSPVIMDGLARHFPKVKCLERPQHLQGGMVSMNDVLLHDIDQCEADFFLQTHSTSPLLRVETITSAIDTFIENYPGHDSLFSVTRLQSRLWDSDIHPVNHNPDQLLRTQDLPPLFEENSGFFIFSAETLRRRKNRIGNSPFIFEISREEAWDIDDEIDFQVAEFLYLQTKQDKEE
jgi:CMP-N-acetylneuraminic acid synthetase